MVRLAHVLAIVVASLGFWMFVYFGPEFSATFRIFGGAPPRTTPQQLADVCQQLFATVSAALAISMGLGWSKSHWLIAAWLVVAVALAGLSAAAFGADWVTVVAVLLVVTVAWLVARQSATPVLFLSGHSVALLWLVTAPLTLGVYVYNYRQQAEEDIRQCREGYRRDRTLADSLATDRSYPLSGPVENWNGPNLSCGEMRKRGLIRSLTVRPNGR